MRAAASPPATWVVEHFINWLAVLFRHRTPTQTAWIFQGTTGTGKGTLFSHIIRPLIGEDYCRSVNLGNLEDQFNAFVESTIVLYIDEVDTDQVRQMPKLMARFKTWITEPKIPLRGMRQDLREVPNHLNLILSSNQPNSMRIEANDRRFNVCPRQEAKLLAPGEAGDELLAQIKSELQDFADYLMSREADPAKARQALDNEPKRLLQTVTQTAIEEVAEAFRKGDLEYLVDNRPSTGGGSILRRPVFDGEEVPIREVYREFLADALDAAKANRRHVVRRKQLFAVFELLVGKMPENKIVLKKRLGHQHLNIKVENDHGDSVRALGVEWKVEPAQLAKWQQLLKDEEAPMGLLGYGYIPGARDGREEGDADGSAA